MTRLVAQTRVASHTCSLKKECKSEKCKFQGSSKSIRIEEIMEYPEFETIFMGKGVLIQPTPTNKPKSAVTIIEYVRLAPLNLFLLACFDIGDLVSALANRSTRFLATTSRLSRASAGAAAGPHFLPSP